MDRFLKEGFHREVRITDHAHGKRVTLHDHFREVSFGVSDNIPMAFDDALKNFGVCLKRLKQEELERLVEQKKKLEIDIEIAKEKIKTVKEKLNEKI